MKTSGGFEHFKGIVHPKKIFFHFLTLMWFQTCTFFYPQNTNNVFLFFNFQFSLTQPDNLRCLCFVCYFMRLKNIVPSHTHHCFEPTRTSWSLFPQNESERSWQSDKKHKNSFLKWKDGWQDELTSLKFLHDQLYKTWLRINIFSTKSSFFCMYTSSPDG